MVCLRVIFKIIVLVKYMISKKSIEYVVIFLYPCILNYNMKYNILIRFDSEIYDNFPQKIQKHGVYIFRNC